MPLPTHMGRVYDITQGTPIPGTLGSNPTPPVCQPRPWVGGCAQDTQGKTPTRNV